MTQREVFVLAHDFRGYSPQLCGPVSLRPLILPDDNGRM